MKTVLNPHAMLGAMSASHQRAIAIFLSAFLMFLLEPLAGKRLLPLLGGTSSVWTAALLFYTATLFLGYAYVSVLARRPLRAQALIHGLLIAIACLWGVTAYVASHGGLMLFGAGLPPVATALVTLLAWVGAPLFLLSTTGPLVQFWDTIETGREPYHLYAISNAGSFLALLVYPFVIEPLISVHSTMVLWALLFMLYVIVMAAQARRVSLYRGKALHETSRERVSFSTRSTWVALAALPSLMLAAVTAEITQVIAPIPLLWVLPLALYLLSFILAFRGWGQSMVSTVLLFISAAGAYVLTPASWSMVIPQAGVYLALLFFTSLRCHAHVYALRPESAASPRFYLHIAFGGMLATAFASVVSPLVFSDYWEFPLAVALAAAAAIALIPLASFPDALHARDRRIVRAAALAFVGVVFMQSVAMDRLSTISAESGAVVRTRDFYGVAAVWTDEDSRALIHGRTLHGMQSLDSGEAQLPSTYYVPGSGIARAIMFEKDAYTQGIRVGTVGLGTGSIAAYCAPGDTFVFYEIDPRIETIARTDFSYLRHCAGSDVRLGDARLSIATENAAGRAGRYDVLAIDAFSDDSIPTHLVTREALRVFGSSLAGPKSIIAFHVSNRYLDLVPVVLRLAADGRYTAMVVRDDGSNGYAGAASTWVLLTRDAVVFSDVTFANSSSWLPVPASHVWTDEYASVLSVMTLPPAVRAWFW